MSRVSTTTVFERVDASSTYEETVTRLGTAIRIGILPAGSRLPPERDLAEQLGISRSTLRQALAFLTETGHLTAVRGRSGGTFVSVAPPLASGTVLGDGELRALLDWRLALELGAVQLAAERGDDADRARLTDAFAALITAEDGEWAAYRRADAAFHLSLAEAARAPRLVAAVTRLQGQLSDVLSESRPDERRAGNEQHRLVLEAIHARDAGRALTAMREHLEDTERRVA